MARPLRVVPHERVTNPRVTKEEGGLAPLTADSSKVMALTQEFGLVMMPPNSSQFYARPCKTALPRTYGECVDVRVFYVLGGRTHYKIRLCLLF